MGQDFDEITISSDGKQLGSFGPNLVDFGGGDVTTGGTLICRDQAGRVAVRLAGGDDQAGGGVLSALGGALHLVNFQGQFRVRIFHGDELENQDGGTILLDAASGSGESAIELNAATRSLHLRDSAGRDVVQILAPNAALYVGVEGNEGDIIVRDNNGKETIRLDGGNGDITLSNADAAEDFTLADGTAAIPGAVMVLAPDGALRPCSSAYDRKVVGVVAGAGSRRPGIVLDRNGDLDGRRAPISMVGKAACLTDAAFGRIEAGDLLTSSPTVGYAMRAADARRAPGATIGKALTPLSAGRGLVEMVISLH